MDLSRIHRTLGRRTPALRVVLLYARRDKEVFDAIRKHLNSVALQGLISIFYDGEIGAGRGWDQRIRSEIKKADIACPFISADFFASKYVAEVEWPNVLRLEKLGRVVICPIILRPYAWKHMGGLGRLQVLPDEAKPVTTWSNHDEAGVSVAEGVRKLALDLLATRKRTGRREEGD